MTNIYEPKNLFDRPFADTGTRKIIPVEGGDADGNASLASGFPTATQLPIKAGGIAPKRIDFNSIFYMLSAFAFFGQSGGIFTYKDTLNYDSPSLVQFDGALWFCIKQNGPGTTEGLKRPGTSGIHWKNFFDYVHEGMTNIGIKFDSNAVGDVKMHFGTTAPEGWFAMQGQSYNTANYPQLHTHLSALGYNGLLPDARGLVPRAYDPGAVRDPDGKSRKIGSIQGDAGINITGEFPLGETYNQPQWNNTFTGCFYVDLAIGNRAGIYKGGTDYNNSPSKFDASRSWGAGKVSSEFRGKNMSFLFCIKHD